MRHAAGCGCLWLAVLAAGCGRQDRAAPGEVGRRAPVAGEAPFRPREDGRLRDADVQNYVRVRRKEAEQRPPTRPVAGPGQARGDGMSLLSDPEGAGSAELGAAKNLRISTEKYAWIKERIVEAKVALDARQAREAALETYKRSLTTLRTLRQQAQDGKGRATLDSQIAALEQEATRLRRELGQPLSHALSLNMEVVRRHLAEIADAEKAARAAAP